MNEHDYFFKAKAELQKHHHEKVTKVTPISWCMETVCVTVSNCNVTIIVPVKVNIVSVVAGTVTL